MVQEWIAAIAVGRIVGRMRRVERMKERTLRAESKRLVHHGAAIATDASGGTAAKHVGLMRHGAGGLAAPDPDGALAAEAQGDLGGSSFEIKGCCLMLALLVLLLLKLKLE